MNPILELIDKKIEARMPVANQYDGLPSGVWARYAIKLYEELKAEIQEII